MRKLFAPALLALAVAGCTSSEPQNLMASAPALQAASPAAAPSFNAGAAPAIPSSAAAMPAEDRQPEALQEVRTAPPAISAAGFPPPPACAPGAECGAPARLEKCRTVGSVTTCDVPPDPAADSTHYTN